MPDPAADNPDDLRTGGPAALAGCFARYRDRLRAMVAFRLNDGLGGRFDPSDVLQEAYRDAAARLPAYVVRPIPGLAADLLGLASTVSALEAAATRHGHGR